MLHADHALTGTATGSSTGLAGICRRLQSGLYSLSWLGFACSASAMKLTHVSSVCMNLHYTSTDLHLLCEDSTQHAAINCSQGQQHCKPVPHLLKSLGSMQSYSGLHSIGCLSSTPHLCWSIAGICCKAAAVSNRKGL